MRELRFVTPGDDAGHIVVETEPSEGLDAERFVLPVTAELRSALDAEPPAEAPVRRPSPTPQPSSAPAPATAGEPAITPREIQIRVRAGETPEEIAEVFAADLAWVTRFALPVIEERGRVTDEARRARARRAAGDTQTVIFGETVDARFSAHGIDPATVGWDSVRREDGQWLVTARWHGGAGEHTAEWTFSLSGRTVAPLDDTATDLLSDRPIRPVFAEAPVTLTTAPPLAPGVVAFPAMPNAHTGPLPSREQLFDQQKFEDAPRPVATVSPITSAPAAAHAPVAPAAAPAPVIAPTPLVTERPTFDAPPLPLSIPEPEPEFELVDEYVEEALAEEQFTAEVDEPTTRMPQVTNLGIAHREPAHRAETEEERAARAHIPSWDDILLGVRRKND